MNPALVVPQSFVSCPVGMWKVGLVTIPFGVMSATSSLLSGRLVARVGRLPLFTLAAIIDLALQVSS